MPASLPAGFDPLLPIDMPDGVVVRGVQFGQGYKQRTLEPINSTIKNVTLKWFVRSSADMQTLAAFLRARATDPLQWQAPDATTAEFYLAKMPFRKTYVSQGHRVGGDYVGYYEVSCDFEWTRF